jgi:hypothetical protein
MKSVVGPTGMVWNRADLFFLRDGLARGMSIQELAGFLNRSEDDVRQRARYRFQSCASQCEDSGSGGAQMRTRHSADNSFS